MLDILN